MTETGLYVTRARKKGLEKTESGAYSAKKNESSNAKGYSVDLLPSRQWQWAIRPQEPCVTADLPDE